MTPFLFQPGETPVLLSIPHVGTAIPEDIAAAMTEAGRAVPDTDWHLDRLYHFAPALGIGFLKGTQARCVIDLNRDPGAGTAELCPTVTFDGAPIYQPGREPDATEVERRMDQVWRPYHDQLDRELLALRDRFGVAVLIDAHSVPSERPDDAVGRPAELNLGSADGTSAGASLTARAMTVLDSAPGRNSVLNGPSRGGFTLRRYGRPGEGIHALRFELCRRTYMEETAPWSFRDDLAAQVRPVIERLLAAVVEWSWSNAAGPRRPRVF